MGSWEPNSPSPKGAHRPFSAHVCCGQADGWIKIRLGREIGLGPNHIVLDGDQAPPPPKGHSPSVLGPCLWPNDRPSQLCLLLSTCLLFCFNDCVRIRLLCANKYLSLTYLHKSFQSICCAFYSCTSTYDVGVKSAFTCHLQS